MGTHDLEARKLADAWARTVSRVRDPTIQIGWVREQLTSVGPARAADVLTIVLARAEQREKRFEVLLLRASLALASPDRANEKRAIARIAEVRGQLSLARLLGNEPSEASFPPHARDEQAEPVDTTNRQLARAMMERGRPLSLGERKTLARRRDRHLLARALRDPHPEVIRILLDNPALTEADVVRLCAQRPAAADVLTQVFRHPRWIVRYRVQRVLALNPYTPDTVTLQLLPHLTSVDLSLVAHSADLSERVRDACTLPAQRPLH
jgi:hypothetical protein